MQFIKMHGLGNDYVYVDCFEERVPNPAEVAKAVSDRFTGIGSDGLILICPSDLADVRMEMYNADGSRGRMCGNGIRCVAKYAVERRRAKGPKVRIETDAGLRTAECLFEGSSLNGRVTTVRVDMGVPKLAPADLPSTIRGERIVNVPFEVEGMSLALTCVSMGNPHAVVFVDHLDRINLSRLGPALEHAPEFPERINAHFVVVDDPQHVTVKTWERGSGATRACGTGACAVCVAGVLTGHTARRVTTALPGGELEIEWADDGIVYMTGPAVEVFAGNWPCAAPISPQ